MRILVTFGSARGGTEGLAQMVADACATGPLGDSAPQREIPPVRGVKALMERVGARGHVTFGGRLLADAKGFPAPEAATRQHS